MSPPISPAPPARPRVDPRLLGMQRGQPVSGPQTLHIDVTNGCNTNCVTCWDHSPLLQLGRSVAWKKQKIDAATVSDILNDVAELGGLRAVILSGMGEPFTHPDIYQMIAEVKRRGLHLTLITNLMAADAPRIVELGVDQLLIGIHGASESSYRAFHPSFCCSTEVCVGTLADGTSFAELWNGPAWNALRARLRRGEYFDSCQQCGKFNQNVQLSQRFAKTYGTDRLYEIIGRNPSGPPAPLR